MFKDEIEKKSIKKMIWVSELTYQTSVIRPRYLN
jgi:hypothetical protein